MLDLEFFRKKYPSELVGGKRVYERVVSFDVLGDRKTVYRLVSNTSLVNKHLGVPERFTKEKDGKLYVETKLMGKPTTWIEHPWRWEFGKYIIANRDHLTGPANAEHAVFHFEEDGPGVQRVYFYYVTSLKGILTPFLYKLAFPALVKKIGKVVNQLIVANDTTIQDPNVPLKREIQQNLVEAGLKEKRAEFIAGLVANSDEDELFKIQLPILAERWGENLDSLLDSFLKAVKQRVLVINWDVICPYCKGSRSSSNSLNDMLTSDECIPCKIVFEVDSIEKIDVTFSVHPDIRKVKEVSFCAAEPFKKSHILFSDEIAAGDTRQIELDVQEGYYRCRPLGPGSAAMFSVNNEDDFTGDWNCIDNVKFEDVGNKISFKIKNETSSEQFMVFESLEPPRYCLSPIKVFNNKVFKSLFSSEKLGEGVQLTLPSQVILFTDIVDSTKFYMKVGDKEAFQQVKTHFDIIYKVTDELGGIIIKTIGDAVMATFKNFTDALVASQEIVQKVDEHPDCIIKLRFSLHEGPVIAVNYNTGVDYFGNNVNLSAKLQAISNANEISISEELAKKFRKKFPTEPLEKRQYLGDRTGYVTDLTKLTL